MPARIRLEPLPGPVVAVTLAHLLLGALIWIFLPLWNETQRAGGAAHDPDLIWRAPGDFLAAPSPPAAIATPPPPATPKSAQSSAPPAKQAQLRPTNKYITISPLIPELEGPQAPPKPYQPIPNLLEIARENSTKRLNLGADMGAVDRAVQETYLKEWVAPSSHLVPPGQRTTVVNIAIDRNGNVSDATLIKTGAPALNVSIVQLLQKVTKIPVTLPSSFQKPRYDLQVNFQIE